MQVVRCNVCGRWIGQDEDIEFNYVNDTECCPICKCEVALMDVDYGCNFDDAELEKLWDLFGEIPIDDNDEILEEFLGFPEGTDRFEIWHWFDEHYSKGVVNLINREGKA